MTRPKATRDDTDCILSVSLKIAALIKQKGTRSLASMPLAEIMGEKTRKTRKNRKHRKE